MNSLCQLVTILIIDGDLKAVEAFLYNFNDEAKFNILIGFSGMRFYGVIVFNENTDKFLVIRFLRRLIEVRRNRYKIRQNDIAIIMDNF